MNVWIPEKNDRGTPLCPHLPPSKSEANRLLMLSFLSGTSLPDWGGEDYPDDIRIMYKALSHPFSPIYLDMSGTAARFLTACLAFCPGSYLLDGAERLKERPMLPLLDALREMGADIRCLGDNHSFPLEIIGKKSRLNQIILNAPHSSQFVSGLMMAGVKMEDGLSVFWEGEMGSRPYLELTASCIELFGGTVELDASRVKVNSGIRALSVCPNPESDWSAAGYWIAIAALLKRPVFFDLLRSNSMQADRHILSFLPILGLSVREVERGLLFTPCRQVFCSMNENLKNCPDLAPTLIILCVLMDIPFLFCGLESLNLKESERINVLTTMLNKIGVELRVFPDFSVSWDGKKQLVNDSLLSFEVHNDHRMAMCAGLFLAAGYSIQLDQPGCVSKSYPRFWDEIERESVGLWSP